MYYTVSVTSSTNEHSKGISIRFLPYNQNITVLCLHTIKPIISLGSPQPKNCDLLNCKTEICIGTIFITAVFLGLYFAGCIRDLMDICLGF